MGNICGPKKITFVKPRSFSNYKLINFENAYCSQYKIAVAKCLIPESKIPVNSYPPEKDAIDSVPISKARHYYWLDNNYLISRSASQDDNGLHSGSDDSVIETDDFLSSDLSESTVDDLTTSSSGQQPISDAEQIIMKASLEKRFRKVCIDVNIQRPIRVQKVIQLLETASRINFASLVDIKNENNNTAVCVAIMKNNKELLQSLLKFMPDFPRFITIRNITVPLVQIAAIQSSDDLDGNILTIILKRWIDDYAYINVALNNVTVVNHESKALFEFLIDEIRFNNQSEIQFMNLELLFKLYKTLVVNAFVSYTTHPKIFRISEFLGSDNFWSDHRKQHLPILLQSDDFNGNYIEIIERVSRLDNNQ